LSNRIIVSTIFIPPKFNPLENADFLTSKALYKRKRGSMDLEIKDVAF
jgi:hypothetical protein